MPTPVVSTGSQAHERTFAFVDLAGFTALTEAHGDEEAVSQVERFVVLTRRSLSHRDQLVKCLGDAVMLCFHSPEEALVSLQQLLRACAAEPRLPIPRAGVHHGLALERQSDWFGATVNLAARVAGQAQGGQTLATGAVASTARMKTLQVTELGRFSLRNIAQPVELFDLQLVPPTESASVDPVCRMQIRHASAAGRLRYDGRDYWFCSFECIGTFTESPVRHIGKQ